MRNITEIIESLCSHEISKQEAINQLGLIVDGLRVKSALEFEIEEISFSVENNHGRLNLLIPYGYSKMPDKLKRGEKVDVIFLP